MDRIPQSVAKRVVLKAYLASDHFSPATGKTIAVVISKNGGAFGNPSGGATNATEIANGWYYVDLSTTDTGTTGPLVVRGTVATIDDVEVIFEVANAFNAGFTGVPGVAAEGAGGLYTRGTGAGQINQAANGQIDVNAVAMATDVITAGALSGGAVTEIQTGLSTLTASGVRDAVGMASANLDTQLSGIQSDTNNIQTRIPTTLVAGLMECVVGEMSLDVLSADAVSAAAVTKIQAGLATSTEVGDVPTAAENATAVWAAGTRTLSSFGSLVADVAAAVWGAVSRTLTAFAFTVAPTAVENADALLGRNLAGGSNGGRMVKDALRPSRNKVSISGSAVTVFEEDDTTPAWTGALTTNASADPITAVDPV